MAARGGGGGGGGTVCARLIRVGYHLPGSASAAGGLVKTAIAAGRSKERCPLWRWGEGEAPQELGPDLARGWVAGRLLGACVLRGLLR
jgi:hypothetical protein